MRLYRLLDPLMRLMPGAKRRPGPPAGVLLISAGGLGDTLLLALMLPRFARLAQAGEEVTVLLRADSAKMAFAFPPGTRVRKVDFNRLRQVKYRWQAARELYTANYRLVIHTDYLRHPDLDEMLVAACWAPETAAMEPRPSRKFARRLAKNRRLYTRLYESGPVIFDKMLRWAGFADFLTGLRLPPPLVRLPEASMPDPLPETRKVAVFQPFSAVKLKQSPPELWQKIAQGLPADWCIKLAGHPSDLDKNPEFRRLLDLPNVEFEGAPFDKLAAIIRGARLVVSVDTACMHLAVALGAPTLCLASAAYVGEIVPYAPEVTPPNAHFVWTNVDCKGCLGGCHLAPVDGMYPCVAALDQCAVLARVAQLAGV